MLPDEAGIVQPVGPEQVEATAAFLTWVAEALDWGRENASRAEGARKHCVGVAR